MRIVFGSFSILALILALPPNAARAAVIYPANNGFEVNNLGSGGGAYEYGTVPGWTISGNPGIAANGSGFGVSGATNGNSDGITSAVGQAALFQGGDGTIGGVSISQSVITGNTEFVSISFSAEERSCCSGGQSETVNVYENGLLIDTVLPPTGSFQNYTTSFFPGGPGPLTLSFAGSTTGGDTTAFIDNVSINTIVPEPPSIFALCWLGAMGLFVMVRRRRAAK